MKKKKRMNIKKRFKNKLFLSSLVSTIILLVTQLGIFPIPENYETIVNGFLTLFALGGVLVDPTTDGMWDSDIGLSNESSTEFEAHLNASAGRKIAELNGLKDELDKIGANDFFNYEEYGRQQMLDGSMEIDIVVKENKQGNIPKG